MNRLRIGNAHEHFESVLDADQYVRVMDEFAIQSTIIVGSPNVTLYQKPDMGFEQYFENNMQVLAAHRRYPNRLFPFVTLNPLDTDNVIRLGYYLAWGAKGLKLYYGLGGSHGKGPFHSVPLDFEGMDPVFEMCRDLNLPIIFHVNRVKFHIELLRFLKKHNGLKVLFPHFMVSVKSRRRLENVGRLLSRHPNVFTDFSHGRENHLMGISRHVTERNKEFRDFFRNHQKQILFGTDLVITRHKMAKRLQYVRQMMSWYRNLMEADRYHVKFLNATHQFTGLQLSPRTQRHVYQDGFLRFLESKVYTPPKNLFAEAHGE